MSVTCQEFGLAFWADLLADIKAVSPLRRLASQVKGRRECLSLNDIARCGTPSRKLMLRPQCVGTA